MTIFQDMTQAVESYPADHIELEIVDVRYPGNALNVSEEGSFRVRVTNTNGGPLILENVTLRIFGRHGATVANNGAISPFESEIVTQELPTIGAHGGSQLTVGDPLKFKAPGSAQELKTLIKVTVESYDVSLDHMLTAPGHTGPSDQPKETYSAEVVAS